MMTLNEQQRRAVTAGDGPLLIVAGPGTGKTKTLTARIAYLVKERDVKPRHILALTFTKKAAEEMSQRVTSELAAGSPKIATFHALCQELLGGNMPFVSEPRRLQIIKDIKKPAAYKGVGARELGLLISRAKNDTAIADPNTAKLVRAYDAALHGLELVDFDDLLLKTYELLRTDEAARQKIQKRFAYILVDEFQDTNNLQYEVLKLMRGNDNLFVIGDPNQSIYGFRGASGTIFAQFMQDFPTATHITLTSNYRSAPQIVQLTNAVFQGSPELKAETTAAGRVRAVEVLNEYSEAAWVLAEIQKAIGGADFMQAVSDDDRHDHRTLRDFAVLYRSRSAAVALQKLFAESGLPYQVVGEGSPYDRPEVLAILALFRALVHDEPIELEGASEAERQALLKLLQPSTNQVPSILAERISNILGFEPSHELAQLIGTLVRFDTVEAALAHVTAIADQQFYDPNADAITLLTIHAAKGLEFPHVFVVGAEDGILPSHRSPFEEEKRLFYVAVTRAKERLEVLHARNRAGQPAVPSAFITDLPKHVLERITDPDMPAQTRRIAKRAAKNSQTSLF